MLCLCICTLIHACFKQERHIKHCLQAWWLRVCSALCNDCQQISCHKNMSLQLQKGNRSMPPYLPLCRAASVCALLCVTLFQNV